MGVDTQVVTSRSEQQKQLDTVTDYINKKNGGEIKEIIESITEDLVYTTDMEKYLSRTNDKDLRYDTININYRKNGELEVYCSRNSRTDVGTNGRSVAEYFTLHIKQGSDKYADITIEANGPSTTYNKDLLLKRVGEFDFNYIMEGANEMYKNLTQPPVAVAPVAVAPVAVVPPKPTNASPPASDKPLSMAERIALFNKKGGRRSRRKSHKNRKSHKKSHKGRKSQRRQ
jgi:hypothetical protein